MGGGILMLFEPVHLLPSWSFVFMAMVVGVTLTYLILIWRVFVRLRFEHPGAWERLGKPYFSFKGNNFSGVILFLVSGEHSVLRDKRLSAYVFAVRYLVAAYLLFLLLGPAVYPVFEMEREVPERDAIAAPLYPAMTK